MEVDRRRSNDSRHRSARSTSESSAGLGRRRSPPSAETGQAGPAPSQEPRARWWMIYPLRGMYRDVRRRAPYYWSDWRDGWDYRVIPATVYMYFANILPALAFSLDMFQNTHSQYGVNEVLLASVLGALVFSLFAAQPLTIIGVTGPITVFNITVYDIMKPTGVNYLAFMAWIGIWGLILHWILAMTNSCHWLRWVTRFPCDIFGFFVATVYLQKGVQVLTRLGDDGDFYLSVMVALLVFIVAYLCGTLGTSGLFTHIIRILFQDYGTPLTIIFFTGFVHIGRMDTVHVKTLPTGVAFEPSTDRPWLVHFWDLSAPQVFLALPFAVLLTILFWFDHNVSSLMAQGSEFPLRKPAGFHWDLFLLGITTGVAGILGLPYPNGLIPQAPFHTEALCVTEVVRDVDEKGEENGAFHYEATRVVEQRVSNLSQGLLTLGTMTGPLLLVLHLVPQGVLAGLFFVMGIQAMEANGITAKIMFLARDKTLTPEKESLRSITRRAAVWSFVAIEVAGYAAIFAIQETIAAVGFPLVILALIPVRALIMPHLFSPEELDALDAPTASDFIMEAIGGSFASKEEADPGGADPDRPSLDRALSHSLNRSTSRSRDSLRRYGHRDSVFASPGSPRKSQEDLAELGQVWSSEGTVTRRRSVSRQYSGRRTSLG